MLNNSHPHAAHVATQLTRQFHRTMVKQDELKFGDEFDALGDRLQALQDELTWHPCGSPQAALFMLGVAWSLADDLRHAGEHGARIKVESTYRAIDRLLDSLMAYVEHTSGVKREDYRLEFFRSRGPRTSWGSAVEEAA